MSGGGEWPWIRASERLLWTASALVKSASGVQDGRSREEKERQLGEKNKRKLLLYLA